jgi:hypothetical protein
MKMQILLSPHAFASLCSSAGGRGGFCSALEGVLFRIVSGTLHKSWMAFFPHSKLRSLVASEEGKEKRKEKNVLCDLTLGA